MGTFREIGIAAEASKLAPPVPARDAIAADLIAVLVAVTSGDPRVLTIQDQSALPSGPFELSPTGIAAALDNTSSRSAIWA